MSLQGKRILITGSTGGLGRHAIDALRARGASVAGIDRKRGDSDRETILADVRDEGQVVRGVAEAVSRLGGLDILINNAGVLSLQDAGRMPGEDVREAVEVNLLGPWRVTAAALPALLESRGRIVNVASLFAVVNAPFIAAYSATKRGLSAYSDSLRFQYGDRIRVVTVYPGFMNTPIHDDAVRQGLSVEKLVSFRFLGRRVFTLEERLERGARGVVRACTGRFIRDRGITLLGTISHFEARHVPRLVDWFIGWRIRRLSRKGILNVRLDAAASLQETAVD